MKNEFKIKGIQTQKIVIKNKEEHKEILKTRKDEHNKVNKVKFKDSWREYQIKLYGLRQWLSLFLKSSFKTKSARNKDRWFNYIRKVNNKYS